MFFNEGSILEFYFLGNISQLNAMQLQFHLYLIEQFKYNLRNVKKTALISESNN